ncbi:MAG: hypothetical protein K2M17_05015 [Bacilli bacterium]|nr:hypothetical protein [Bacilli bacterium]
MKLPGYEINRSSFLSVQNDLRLVVEAMLKDETLCKLLYYTDKDCLNKPKLTQEQVYSLVGNQIKIVPRIQVDEEMYNYVLISTGNYAPSKNPQFRDNTLVFDIVCNLDIWNLGNYQLRPFLIAGEIDKLFNNKHLTGIGKLEFAGMDRNILNHNLAGYTLVYYCVHGTDDLMNKNE